MKLEIDKVPPKGYVYFVGDELFFAEYSVADGRILLSDGRNISLAGFASGGVLLEGLSQEEILSNVLHSEDSLLLESFAPVGVAREKISQEGILSEDISLDELSPEGLSFENFSEIHFFDEKTEYRILCDGGETHTFLLSGADDSNYVTIREDVWVRPEFWPGETECRIAVVNRFEYTEDDRLRLTSFRLSGGEYLARKQPEIYG